MELNIQELKDILFTDESLTIEEKNDVLVARIISAIANLKFALSESDWKVIVNSELSQEGLDPKYVNLHLERQAWRDEINLLEDELKLIGY